MTLNQFLRLKAGSELVNDRDSTVIIIVDRIEGYRMFYHYYGYDGVLYSGDILFSELYNSWRLKEKICKHHRLTKIFV